MGGKMIDFMHWKTAVAFMLLSCFSLQAIAAEEAGLWRYTVRPGDNLITLGKKHLINPDDWKTIQRLNQVKNPYRMQVGKVLQVPLGLVKQAPASAEVIFVSGQADLQVSAVDTQPLAVGQKLGAGANISTKENSKVVIRFADGTTSELASNSNLKLDTMSLYSGGAMVDTRLRLQKGQLQTHANPKHEQGNQMQVITPSAIAAVRGTKFRVSAGDKAMVQETLDGRVGLAAQGTEVLVNKGFGSKVEQGKAPLPPVVLLPAANTTALKKHYQSLPLTFELPDMQGAAAWAGKVVTDQQLNQIIAESESKTQQLVFADVADGNYFLNVRAKDKNGIAGYDALHAFTVNARPLQPALISPSANEVVRQAKPLLSWQPVAEAKLYSVEIAQDKSFQQVHETNRVATTEYQVSKNLAPGTYFLRLTSVANDAKGKEDIGPAIKVSQFTYKPLPPKPDVSQLTVKVANNRVYVNTLPPADGMTYDASLDNEFNHQIDVWQGRNVKEQFSFLLKEYGKQTLYIKHIDRDGVSGPAAVYEFYAHPE